jgi:GT2 family glycosyltransferase
LPKISVIVIARNEAGNLRRTFEQLQATLPEQSEIVVVDDGSDDGSTDFLAEAGGATRLIRAAHLGVARARNLGARHAQGEVLVFADAHVAMPPGWWTPMTELLAASGVGAVAPVISDMEEPGNKGFGQRLGGPDLSTEWLPKCADEPYKVPLLPGGYMAMRRDTFDVTGGFDEGMLRWGSEDTELSLRLWLLGYELWLVPGVEVAHLFRDELPFDIEWSWILHNKLRLAFLHFSTSRIASVVEALREREGFSEGLALTLEGDVFARRAELASRRSHNDAWFFERFETAW